MEDNFLQRNKDLIIVLTLYSVLAVFSLRYYQYQIGGDELSYINIAREYASGNWGAGINGYWSPLISWLMVPFLSFGFTHLYAVHVSKVLCLIIGFFTIISVKQFSNLFNLDKTVKRALLFSLIPVVLLFSLTYNTPDLLLACLLVYYLSIVFDPNYFGSWHNGVLCGFVGALAYFAKSYAFPFFVVHFIFFNLLYYFKGLNKQEKEGALKNLILGLMVFFVVSGLWIGTISDKYGKLTIGTAGEYNQALMGPEYAVNTLKYGENPVYYVGLIKPPKKSAISIWDEPSYSNLHHWSPFDSWGSFIYQLKLIWANIEYTTEIIESFFLIAVVILISVILFILKIKPRKTSKNLFVYILISMFIYMGGYCIIIPEWRYLWFICLLVMMIAFCLVDSLFKDDMIGLHFRNILLILLILSFVLEPAYEIYALSGDDHGVYSLSSTLKSDYGIQGNIASNAEWGKMLPISYYLDAHYYGLTKKNSSYPELEKELTENNIQCDYKEQTAYVYASSMDEVDDLKTEYSFLSIFKYNCV